MLRALAFVLCIAMTSLSGQNSSAGDNDSIDVNRVTIHFIGWHVTERVPFAPEVVRNHARMRVEILREPFISRFLDSLALEGLSAEGLPDVNGARVVIDVVRGGETQTFYATRFHLIEAATGRKREIDEQFRKRFEQILE